MIPSMDFMKPAPDRPGQQKNKITAQCLTTHRFKNTATSNTLKICVVSRGRDRKILPTPPNNPINCCFIIPHSLATTRGVAADTSTPRDHCRMNVSLQRTSFRPLSLEVGMEPTTHAKSKKLCIPFQWAVTYKFKGSRVSTRMRQKESCTPFQSSPRSPTDRLPRIIWAITSWMWFLVRLVREGQNWEQIPNGLRQAETCGSGMCSHHLSATGDVWSQCRGLGLTIFFQLVGIWCAFMEIFRWTDWLNRHGPTHE